MPAPLLIGSSNSSFSNEPPAEETVLHQRSTADSDAPHTEIHTCQLKRCQEKNERNGLKTGTFLFATKWRAMKIGARRVWVLDLTTLCPDCYTEQSRTLIPPGYVDDATGLVNA